MTEPRISLDNYPWKKRPLSHQYWALDNSWALPAMSFDCDMGLGKTFITIANIGLLAANDRITHALIFAPKAVTPQWVTEFEKFWPDEFEAPVIHLWKGMNTKREEKEWRWVTGEYEPGGPLRVLIMNIEALSSKKGVHHATKFLDSTPGDSFIVVDESTKIKSPTAARAKAAVRLAGRCRYKRKLSGLPFPNSPLDAYSQYAFLGGSGKMDCAPLGFSSFFQFKNRYAVLEEQYMGARSFKTITGYQRLDELQVKMKPYQIRLRKKDCLDLPEKIYIRREVELTTEQKKLYRELSDRTKIEVREGTITSLNFITKLLRFQQLVSGWMVPIDGANKTPIEIPSNRISALLEVAEENSKQTIVWSHFTATSNGIVKYLREAGYTAEVFNGTTTPAERERILRSFSDGDLQYIVPHPETAGMGLNWAFVDQQIWFTRDFSYDTRAQGEDRTHRIGMKGACTYLDLVAPDTVDDKILTKLRDKRATSEFLLGDKDVGEWI